MTAFDVAVARVLESEGDAFTDAPHDKGGPTKFGITERTLLAAKFRHLVSEERLVATLTREEAIEIYRALYWQAIHADALPPRVAYVLFDAAVNSGVTSAATWLQKTLVEWGQFVAIDGVIGHDTIVAAGRVANLADAVLATRAQALFAEVQKDPTQGAWLHGWLTREFRVAREAATL